jgi:hypothetical protein
MSDRFEQDGPLRQAPRITEFANERLPQGADNLIRIDAESLAGAGHRCLIGKRRQCEVAHTSPPSGTITYGATRLISGVFGCGATMLSGDSCKRSTPRVELDQRARDTRLGLEQIERLILRASDRYDLAQAPLSTAAPGRCSRIRELLPVAA